MATCLRQRTTSRGQQIVSEHRKSGSNSIGRHGRAHDAKTDDADTLARWHGSRLLRGAKCTDGGEQRFDRFARDIAYDEYDARSRISIAVILEHHRRVKNVLCALQH